MNLLRKLRRQRKAFDKVIEYFEHVEAKSKQNGKQGDKTEGESKKEIKSSPGVVEMKRRSK